jgi:PAS domain S-box-containing protein
MTGLIEQLGRRYPDINPSIEYLDTKRFPTQDHLLFMKDYLAGKYRGQKFDLVITLDNPALDMVLRHRQELFPGTPIVFAGVNDFQPSMLAGQEKVTGVAEKLEIAGTLKTMLALHPETKEVFVIHDYTATGLATRREMESLLPDFQSRVHIKFTPPATIGEIINQIKALPAKSLVLILSFAADKTGQTLTHGEITRLVTSGIDIPAYSVLEARLGHGIVGGILLGGKEQGRRAGDVAIRVLAGEDPSRIPVDIKSTARPMFDFNQLRRFHIPLSALPAGSIIINHPPSFYQVNKGLVWGTSGMVIALSLMVLVLILNNTRRRRAEGESRRFASFPHLNPNPVLEADLTGEITYANKAAHETLRQLGRQDLSAFLPKDLEGLIQSYLEEGKNPFVREVAIGETVLAETVHVAEEFKAVRIYALDITQRIQAEGALRASEERYRTVADYTYDMEYWVDPEGKIRYISPACERLSGYPAQAFVNDPQLLDRIVHPEDRALFIQHKEEALTFTQIYDLDFRLIHRNGQEFWVNHTCQPVFAADGQPLGRRVSNRNITERKLAVESFQSLVSSAPMGIYIVQDGKFVMINPGFEVITGYSAPELIGQDCLSKVRPDYRAFVRQQAIQRLKGEGLPPYEYQFIAKDGKTGWVMETVTPTQYHGEKAVLGYFMDITPLKKLETRFLQAQKMEAVARLAGGVAHDFNNMLGVIIGHTEMALMQVNVTGPLHTNLQEILKAAERSSELTRQLLAFARQQTVRPLVLNLNVTVEGMLKMLQRLIGEDIDLVWAPDHDLWKVRIDPSQIDQIIANLAVNARDAIAGVGKLTIQTNNAVIDADYCANHPEFVPGEYVLLAVSDDGCGMDKETLAQIFEPFFTTKGVGEGTGLGLATVYGIVKQNNGFINVYSEPGHGTTFKIYLSRCQAEAAQESKTAVKSLQGGSETVLMVEDEKAILDIGQAILEKLGYTVLTAGTPGEAIRLAGEYPGDIQLLISDVVMPEMHGRELAERLIAMKPELKCLYMSGYTTNVIAHRGVLDEGVHFIQKPFSMQDLAEKVREVLEG